MLVTKDHLLTSVERRRCVRSGRLLKGDEAVVCRQEFEWIYSTSSPVDKASRDYLVSVLLPALQNARSSIGDRHRHDISLFLRRVIHRDGAVRERFLHLFLFMFWKEVRFADGRTLSFDVCFYEGEPVGNLDASLAQLERRLLPLLLDQKTARPDLIAYDSDTKSLFLIEVKPAELDDRGVGQLIRYFRHAASVVNVADHKVDVRVIKPVLICQQVTPATWTAFDPAIFELSSFFGYNITDSELELHDLKRRGRVALRERAKYHSNVY